MILVMKCLPEKMAHYLSDVILHDLPITQGPLALMELLGFVDLKVMM